MSNQNVHLIKTINVTFVLDMIDNSGVRITYTPTLRQYDAGLLTIGMKVGSHHIIPPFEEDFINEGFCTEDCLRQVRYFLFLNALIYISLAPVDVIAIDNIQ